MSDDRERKLFEVAMRQPPMQWGDKDFGLGWATDTYARYETLCAWDGWRLGRAALRAELDGTVAVPRELLEECLEDMRDLRGEHDWHKNEPRCGHAAEYARLSERIARIETMLAGDGARGDGK